jgi:hypothetical protein
MSGVHIKTKYHPLQTGGPSPPFDELMAPQNILVSNQKQQAEKYYKEYDKLSSDLMYMWRRLASKATGLQTCPNC